MRDSRLDQDVNDIVILHFSQATLKHVELITEHEHVPEHSHSTFSQG